MSQFAIPLEELVFHLYRLHRGDRRICRLSLAMFDELTRKGGDAPRIPHEQLRRMERMERLGEKAFQQMHAAINPIGAGMLERGQNIAALSRYLEFAHRPLTIRRKRPAAPVSYMQSLTAYRARLDELFAFIELENRQISAARGVAPMDVHDHHTVLKIPKRSFAKEV